MLNKKFQQLISLIVLCFSMLTNVSLVQSQSPQIAIAKLANGSYQFCSEPKPNDWRDGAGVCLNFIKVGDRIDGYYGYSHSDIFICIRGNSLEDMIVGKALGLFGSDMESSKIPQNKVQWDIEHRLALRQGKIIRRIFDRNDHANWVLFQAASLNVKGLYQYQTPQMTPASKLCDWSIINIPE